MDKISVSKPNLNFLRKKCKCLPGGLFDVWLKNPEFVDIITKHVSAGTTIDEEVILEVVVSIGDQQKSLPKEKRDVSIKAINRTIRKLQESLDQQ